jgi:hypothetical protein
MHEKLSLVASSAPYLACWNLSSLMPTSIRLLSLQLIATKAGEVAIMGTWLHEPKNIPHCLPGSIINPLRPI